MENIVQKIAKKFNDNGFQVYEVGGHVRDSFLNRASHDIDLTTNAPPTKIKELLEGLGSLYTMGETFGTIGLNVNGHTIEVTTYRKEVYPSDSRKPEVVFGNSLEEDLSRRDFTINAIAREPLTGTVVDPFGGLIDMKKKIIKVVGGNERFDEDPLRMLRAIRFACELGFALDVRIEHPERLEIISKERIREELNRILLSKRAAYGWRKLCQTGLIYYVVPEFMDLKNIQQGKNHIKDAYEHSLLVLHKGSKLDEGERNLPFRLACILHDIGKPETKVEDEDGVHFYSHHNVGARKARKVLRRLRYDNETVQSVCHLIKYHMTPIVLQREIVNGKIKKRIIMRLVRKVGEDNINLLLDLVKCDIRSSKNPRYKFMTILTRMVNECLAEQPSTLTSPIDGNEVMKEFNLKPGRVVGEVKNYLTNLVVDGKLDKDDREGAFAKAREYIDGRRHELGAV
jgi:poly(A) polymerase